MQRKDNIIIFLMDTQRADNLSCYGYHKKTTPNIDAIADEGVIFTSNIIPGVWTLPSHASLFTGRYVSGHGADAHHEFLPAEFPTMAEILGKLGYRTVGLSNNGWVSRSSGIARGFDEYYLISREKTGKVEWFYVEEKTFREEEKDRGSLKTVNAAVSWIKNRYDGEKPFFMFINVIEPHGPYRPPEPFKSRFLSSSISKEEIESLPPLRSVEECIDIRTGELELPVRYWEIQKALYDGCTATVDDRIGRLYKHLEEEGILDDTIFIITSDHGDVQGEHLPHVEHHLCAYDELIRVPLVVRYPKALPRGKKVRWITQTLDILPTILDLLNVKDDDIWRTIQGLSMLPAVDDEPLRDFALTEYMKSLQQLFLMWRRHPKFDVRNYNYWLKAVRTLKYKYIWHSNGKDELYDLEEDPSEKQNIACEEMNIVEEMREKMGKFLLSIDRVDYGDYLLIGRRQLKMPGSEDIFKRLEAWGFYRTTKPALPPEDRDVYI